MASLADPYSGDDFYCDVALRNIHALDVAYDSPSVLAYHHTRPYWQVHVVVVPKRHIASLTTLTAVDEALIREFLIVVQNVAGQVEAAHGAARVCTNLGAYQDSKHFHVHVLSGERR